MESLDGQTIHTAIPNLLGTGLLASAGRLCSTLASALAELCSCIWYSLIGPKILNGHQNRLPPTNASQSIGDFCSYSRQFAIRPLTIRTMTIPCVRIS